MLTDPLRSQINRIWDAFWSGGISDPLDILEQTTYLLFLRHLDHLYTVEEHQSVPLDKPVTRCIFPGGKNAKGQDYETLRWSRFKNLAPSEMYAVVRDRVFPFLRTIGWAGLPGTRHMRGIRFTIPTPAVLAQVVGVLEQMPRENLDTKGDLYGYMLNKIVGARQNGPLRIPRHIIRVMVELTAPTIKDVICDPTTGSCDFLVAAGEYLKEKHPEILRTRESRRHFQKDMFHGYDFDQAMLRIGSMNMVLHGVTHPNIRHKDWLLQDNASDEGNYSLVLAAPLFPGSRDYANTVQDLLDVVVKTKKNELLFLPQFLRLLKPGGRAAIIVSDSILSGSSTAHQNLRRKVVEEQRLDAVIALPCSAFKPYADVATSILLFTKTNSGSTGHVWFYDVQADGWSLDDTRQPLLDEAKLGVSPRHALTKAEHAKNNLPDLLSRWQQRDSCELARPRTAQSFCIPKADIIANGYHLAINRYRAIPPCEAGKLYAVRSVLEAGAHGQ
jgi:type I restriction enzyme M protein